MGKQKDPEPSDYIVPLNMNGLMGRMMRVPSTNPNRNREILIVYGHHGKLERWWGLIQNFTAYGNVTMPDLPGFGGMDSFYKIGRKPSIDNLADYLAAFIKLRYKRRRLTIFGISFGFVVATRMLQRYPELAKKVDLVVSGVGFAHHDDFTFTPLRMFLYRAGVRIIGLPGIIWLFKVLCLNKVVLRYAYTKTHNARHRFEEAAADSLDTFNAAMEFEYELWRINDLKTHMYTTREFLHVDNCGTRLDLPVWHIGTKGDYYFKADVVEQHLRIIFNSYDSALLDMKTHAPGVLATKKEAAVFLPHKFRQKLNKLK